MEVDMENLLSTKDAAAYLALRPGTLATWRSQGRSPIPFVRIGRAVRYRIEDLVAFVEEQRTNKSGHASTTRQENRGRISG